MDEELICWCVMVTCAACVRMLAEAAGTLSDLIVTVTGFLRGGRGIAARSGKTLKNSLKERLEVGEEAGHAVPGFSSAKRSG